MPNGYEWYGTEEDKRAYEDWLKTFGWRLGRAAETEYGGSNRTFQQWVALQKTKVSPTRKLVASKVAIESAAQKFATESGLSIFQTRRIVAQNPEAYGITEAEEITPPKGDIERKAVELAKKYGISIQAARAAVTAHPEAYEIPPLEKALAEAKKVVEKQRFIREYQALLDRAQWAGLPSNVAEEMWESASARVGAGQILDISDYKTLLAKRLNISGDFEQGLAERTEAFGEREWRVEQAQAAAGRKQRLAREWKYAPPTPEWAPAWYETTAGLGGTGSWQSWFKGKYSDILGRFRAEELPEDWQTAAAWGTVKEKVSGWRQLKAAGEKYEYRRGQTPAEVEAQIEKRLWPEYLRQRKPELREEWWGLGPYARGERPSQYAPPIRTIQF